MPSQSNADSIHEAAEFTDDELRAVLHQVGKSAREEAFAAGVPVTVIKNGSLVAILPDGTERVIKQLNSRSNGSR